MIWGGIGRFFSDNIRWGTIQHQVTLKEDDRTSPLIDALKKVESGHKDHDEIAKWCSELARIFCLYDEDNNGNLDEDEYMKMIEELPLSDELRDSLSHKFHKIDIDHNGCITLREFLFFFLSFPPMKKQLVSNFDQNEPYRNTLDLSILQKLRLWIYKVVTIPSFNMLSKLLYCGDIVLTLIPFCIIYVQVIWADMGSAKLAVLWFLVFYFGAEYVLGLLTCKSKKKFILNGMHIVELISFLPWIVYNLMDCKTERKPSSEHEPFLVGQNGAIGFFLFRILRVIGLTEVISLRTLKENIDIYVQTINLALTSYTPMGWALCFMTIFLSTLVYAFERGDWNGERWIRGEESEQSPFGNFFNCMWYTLVTGTTLGYGDIYPKSYEGKLVGILIVILGLVNITVIINTIGQCFEEIFRDYLENRSKNIQRQRSSYIKQQVDEALEKLNELQRSKSGSSPSGIFV